MIVKTVSRQAVDALPKLQRAVILLLEEQGDIEIIDDYKREEKDDPPGEIGSWR